MDQENKCLLARAHEPVRLEVSLEEYRILLHSLGSFLALSESHFEKESVKPVLKKLKSNYLEVMRGEPK